MATTIKLKNGSGAPSASDLVQGEPALDLTNNRLYSENGSGSVVEIGTNPTSLSINGTAITATAAELNILDGVTSTAAELNILDGVTSTTAELNILDGVTATTAELNFVDGVTSNIQTQLDAKGTGTVSSLSDLSVTATAAELNIMDGVTATTAELNIMDGVTSTTAELNILDGVTSTAAELNILDGVTSTTAELNILDGVTATTAELNILDGVTSTAAELNILDGVTSTTAELNILDGVTAFVDEDDMSSDSATSIPSQQSVKAYVDSQVASADTLAELTDTNITSPADGALLFYDTATSKWIDNVVSGDVTIADTGVAAIGSGVIVNDDINASAAISVSKTALTAGTGLTLTTNTLSVDASQTQITAVGTIGTGTWQGTAIADAYVANDLTISGGTVDNTVIGASTAAAGTFTTFTSNGIDDNADAVAITIDSSENVGIGTTSPSSFFAGATNLVIGGGSGDEGITIYSGSTGSGRFHFADGTSGAAEYDGFIVYDHNNQKMLLGSAGATAATIDSSGNVGIGTTSPNTYTNFNTLTINGTNGGVLDLEKNGTLTGELYVQSGATDIVLAAAQSTGSLVFMAGGLTERARINTSGDISIGSSSNHAGARVVINDTPPTAFGSPMFQIGQETFTSSGYYSIGLGYTAASYTEPPVEIAAATTSSSGGTTADIVFGTRSVTTNTAVTERMRISSSGNVQISTSAGNYTDALLTARNAGNSIDWGHTNTAGYGSTLGAHAGSGAPFVGLSCGAGTNSNTFRTYGLKGALITTDNAGSLLFSRVTTASADNQSPTESMRIDSSGALLIGRTSGNPNSSSFGINFDGGGRMLAASNYGATGTAHQLYGNAGSVRILGDGDLENTNNSYTGLSDERLKSNIVDASSQIDDIMAVQVRSYTLNETGATHIGVVAQELEASGMSGLVKTKDDGMKSVKYSILYLKAIKALQEAVTRIETLEAEVAALKGA